MSLKRWEIPVNTEITTQDAHPPTPPPPPNAPLFAGQPQKVPGTGCPAARLAGEPWSGAGERFTREKVTAGRRSLRGCGLAARARPKFPSLVPEETTPPPPCRGGLLRDPASNQTDPLSHIHLLCPEESWLAVTG